jgi:hypothetical protein
MEPLMTLDGYRVIENEKESRELLNKFYEQKGIMVVGIQDTDTKESGTSGSIYKQENK